MRELRYWRALIAFINKTSSTYLVFAVIECILYVTHVISRIVFPMIIVIFLIGDATFSVLHLSIFLVAMIVVDKCNRIWGRKMDDERSNINLSAEKLISEKLLSLEFSTLEDPNVLELKSGASYAILSYKTLENTLKHLKELFGSIFIVIVSSVYLISNNTLIMLILTCGTIMHLILSNRLSNKLSIYFKGLYKINRKFDWFSSLKTNLFYQKDIRIFKMENMLVGKIAEYNEETTKTFSKMNDLTFANELLLNCLNTFVLVISYIVSGIRVLTDSINFGEFVLVLSLVGRLNQALIGLSANITSTIQMLKYLEPVILFMNLPKKNEWGEKSIDSIESIEFVDVSFKYPFSNDYTLKNISFVISKGMRMGIVGQNASGKSTLIKLICALYEPTDGKILVNGNPIKAYKYEDYVSMLSVVFQDYNIFEFSISDNVSMCTEVNQGKMCKAIVQGNMEKIIQELPQKEHTVISLQYDEDGINLSVGERQKIAIARALYRSGSVFVFDEPTASLDPLAEYNTYLQYNAMSKNSICIYISHRIATTKFCDKILVLDDGCVEAIDTHDNLLADLKSLYARLYFKQKEKI